MSTIAIFLGTLIVVCGAEIELGIDEDGDILHAG